MPARPRPFACHTLRDVELADHTTAPLLLPPIARARAARAQGAAVAAVLVPAGVGGDALAHEHARARGGLEDVVDALDLERGTLLVRAGADRLRDAFCLVARDVVRGVGRACEPSGGINATAETACGKETYREVVAGPTCSRRG